MSLFLSSSTHLHLLLLSSSSVVFGRSLQLLRSFGSTMAIHNDFLKPILLLLHLLTILYRVNSYPISSSSSLCDFSFQQYNKLYNFSLASPLRNYPHGVLSEDGFYKVAVNKSLLWFQLCDGMIFNHDPPRCLDCLDCGGPSRCGMGCSALVSNFLGGYYVCTTVGQSSSTHIDLIDKEKPHNGVIVKMTSSGPKINCSLSVSVLCDSNGVQGPSSLEKVGTCDYATVLKHPSGCATIISVHGSGWGWFGILATILLCLLGGYLLAGAVYRFFFLRVRGIEVIPNLEFWVSLPQRVQSLFGSLVRRFRRPHEGYRSSYSPVNF